MKIIVATGVGKNSSGHYFDLFPSRWSATSRYHANTYYPFDLGYLSSMLKRDTDHDIKMVDGNYFGFTVDVYTDALIAEKPDLIIMEADSLTYNYDMEILKRVKEKTSCKVVMCGQHPTSAPNDALKDGADFVAIGEFQDAIVNLVKSDFDVKTRGIFPNGRAPLMDIKTLPFPEDDDISRRDYCRLYACEYRQIEMFPTRGCPVNCNYCVVRNVYHGEGNIRCRSVDNVIQEIENLLTKYPDLEGFFFNEESHTANKKYTHQLCDAIIEAGLNDKLKFDCMCNFAALDEDLLIKMKKAGYYKIRVGIETFDEDGAREIFTGNWKKDIKKMMEVMHICRDIGMKVYGTTSVGTIGSNSETDKKTLSIIKQLHADNLLQECQVSINTPMPGTPFYTEAKQNGWIIESDIELMDGNKGSVLDLPGYPKEDIDATFEEFRTAMRGMLRQNQDKGVNYSMYDQVWVKKVLDVTKVSETY